MIIIVFLLLTLLIGYGGFKLYLKLTENLEVENRAEEIVKSNKTFEEIQEFVKKNGKKDKKEQIEKFISGGKNGR